MITFFKVTIDDPKGRKASILKLNNSVFLLKNSSFYWLNLTWFKGVLPFWAFQLKFAKVWILVITWQICVGIEADKKFSLIKLS